MMPIRHAIITAAAPQQRDLPLQRLVDRDGVTKTVLQILIEEARSAGIEQVCVVIGPGASAAYTAALGSAADAVHFVEQKHPLGYGHALWCARTVVGDAPFVHLVGDHLYLSTSSISCARQLVEFAATEACALSAVHPSRESLLPFYGVVGGRRVAGRGDCYQVERVAEKPTPTVAEQELFVPGLRAGHYLCFFGMHVLTPMIMEILAAPAVAAEACGHGNVQLSPALNELATRERYLAIDLHGRRCDVGERYGLLTAQLALALAGTDREEVLARLVELVALR